MRSVAMSAASDVAVAALGGGAQAGLSDTSNRVLRFTDLPRSAAVAIPRDVRPQARLVGVVDGQRIVAAPTRNGNFCEAFVGKRGRGWGGCRVRETFSDHGGRDFHAYLIGATIRVEGTAIRSVSGSTLAGPQPVNRSAMDLLLVRG